MMRAVAVALLLFGCTRAQHEVTAAGPLITDDGRLREPGWARRRQSDARRSRLRASSHSW
jgi:hypothetical protein